VRQTIFISYSWSDTTLADRIDNAFQPTGLYIKRDIREIAYKGSIKEYMSQVRDTDFVLLIISDHFIKSPKCMYEVLELLKEKDYKKKILPVIADGTKLFKPEERLEYIHYWSAKFSNLEKDLKKVKTTDALELYNELRNIEKIKNSIDDFLAYISDANSPNFSQLVSNNFKKIFDYIGVSDNILIKRILSLKENSTIDEIEIELDKIEVDFPNNSKVYFTKGSYAFRENKIAKSNYYYRKSIELDETFSSSYYNLAYNIEVYDKNYDEAKWFYEKAIELEPTNTRALNNLGGIYSKELNNPDKAKELYETLLEINPYDAEGHFNLAVLIHRVFEDYDTAKYHYEFAIEIEPDFVAAKHNYGLLLWENYQEYAKVKSQFLEILEIEKNNKKTLKLLGRLFEQEYKNYDTAKIYYDRFISVEPNDAEDHYWYSMFLILYFRPKFKELARHHYEIACSLDESFKSEHVEILLR
jgi:tetratricopeptide (TPR) repeat protein